MGEYVLTISCANRRGIVAAVANHLFESGCNILDAQQHDDTEADRFFMWVTFDHPEGRFDLANLQKSFAAVANKFAMTWKLRDRAEKRKVAILVSKSDHCLADMLYLWRIGELSMDPVAIISNHTRDTFEHLDFASIPFHHLPLTGDDKQAQEQKVGAILQKTQTDLVVLARYMQILSNDLARKLEGRCINIHHSFLPGFKGAKPYHQAHARGVKLIGATAHYVTPDLDEGPIIAQDVEAITHRDTPEELVRKGRDIERRVLTLAVRSHLEDRVLLNGQKTVVFT